MSLRVSGVIRLCFVLTFLLAALASVPVVGAAGSTGAAAMSAAPAKQSETLYIVKRGDTLYGIARRHGTSVEAIMRANNLRSTRIYVGQRLRVPTAAPTNCINKATFIRDVSIPDDSPVEPGEGFLKIWRLRNDGTCHWNGYSLVFSSGEPMTAQRVVALPATRPGQTVDIQVEMTAPWNPGTYEGRWVLRDQSGMTFGVGRSGQTPVWIRIKVNGPNLGTATISGVVWEDFCHILSDGSPSSGCVPGAQGGYQADGLFNNGERRISGVVVELYRGTCGQNTRVSAQTQTDWDGTYEFLRLEPGTYCVSVNPLVEPNFSLLVPGGFTNPEVGHGNNRTVTVGANGHQTVNFGWDYQFR